MIFCRKAFQSESRFSVHSMCVIFAKVALVTNALCDQNILSMDGALHTPETRHAVPCNMHILTLLSPRLPVLNHTAIDHGLTVLFHEKPFKGLNGSGKHNNW